MWKYITLLLAIFFGWILHALLGANREDKPGPRCWHYDFHQAEKTDELRRVLHAINESGYFLVSVTQDSTGMYTVFFGRAESA